MSDKGQAKISIITGANTGIGKISALEIARAGYDVLLACRSETKTRPVVDEINSAVGRRAAEFLPLDLSSLKNVERAARSFLDRGQPLSLLVNNAGLAGQRGQTEDGFELAFGVNHLGHFLFTQLLIDRLKEAAPSRIVNVSSIAHTKTKGIDWSKVRGPTRSFTGLPEYSVSKLANVLYTKELDARYREDGIHSYALHPGVVASDIWRRIPWPFRNLYKLRMITVEEGAQTTLHCALSDEAGAESGLYYDESRVKEPQPAANDVGLAKELWRRSEQWVASYLDETPAASASAS